jgi:hypothetical protein
MMQRGSVRCNARNEWKGISEGANRITDTTSVATEITRLTAAGGREHELVAKIARRFPDPTTAKLSAAAQDAATAAERQIIKR